MQQQQQPQSRHQHEHRGAPRRLHSATITTNVLMAQDVVGGRGDQHAGQVGNLRFYRIIDEHLEQYSTASTKFEKSHAVQAIFTAILPGRFLRKQSQPCDDPLHSDNGNYIKNHVAVYQVMEEKEARQKISHALRYRLKQATKNPAHALTARQDQRQDNSTTTSTAASQATAMYLSSLTMNNTLSVANTTIPQNVFCSTAPSFSTQQQQQQQQNGNSIFSDSDLLSVLGDPSIFGSIQTMTTANLLRLFAKDQQPTLQSKANAIAAAMTNALQQNSATTATDATASGGGSNRDRAAFSSVASFSLTDSNSASSAGGGTAVAAGITGMDNNNNNNLWTRQSLSEGTGYQSS